MSAGGEKDPAGTDGAGTEPESGLEALAAETEEIPIPGPDEVDALSVRGPGLDSPLVSPALPQGGQGRAARPPTALDHAVALQRAGRIDEAIHAYDALLQNEPGDARAWLNLGVALRGRGRLEAAAACYRRALALEPQNAGAYSNLGNVLRLLGRHQEATQCQHRALEIEPNYHAAAYNMALVLHDVRLWREALRYFDRALAGGYDRPEVRLDRAATLLAAGDYAQGFAEYEQRLKPPGAPPLPATSWTGGPLEGKSILVQLEGGARETLMFLRYLPALAARGARVAVAAPAPMAAVIATIGGVAEVHVPGPAPPPPADLTVQLNSLPHRFGTTLDTVPAAVPYLAVPPNREPRQWLPAVAGAAVKVGIIWADRSTDAQREDRTCPFVHFLRLAAIPGVVLYRLQTGPAAADRDRAGAGALVRDIAGEFRDLADAAEAMAQIDCVVGVDSAALLLAGALGKPGYVVLPTTADWRWTDDPDRTPWWPTFRLFRQRRPGDWDDVFVRIADALTAEARTLRPAASPATPAASAPPPSAPPSPAPPSPALTSHSLAASPLSVLPPVPPPLRRPPAALAALEPEPAKRSRAVRTRTRKSPARPPVIPSAVETATLAAQPSAPPAPPSAPAPPVPSVEDAPGAPPATDTPAEMRVDEPGAGLAVEVGAGRDGHGFALRRFLDEHLEPGDTLVDLGVGMGLFALAAASRHEGRVHVIALDPDAERLADLRRAADQSSAGQTTIGPSIETVHATLGAKVVASRGGAAPVVTLDGLLNDRPACSGRVFLRLDSGGREPEIVAGGIDLLAQGRIAAMLWRRGAAYDEPAVAVRFTRLIDDLGALGFRHFRLPDDNLGGPLVPYAPLAEPATIFTLPRGFERKREYSNRSPTARASGDDRRYAALDPAQRKARTAALKLAATSDASRWADPANLEDGARERAALAAPHLAGARRLLDLGAGATRLKDHRPAGTTYIPADLVPRTGDSIVIDLNQGDFPAGLFDAVALLEVLEFLHDPLAVMKRAHDAAGRLVLTYRLSEGGDADARAAAGWFNAFNRSELEAQLAMAGWVVVTHRREGAYDLFVCHGADKRA